MSTVSMMLEDAERLSNTRAVVQNTARAACPCPDEQAHDEQEVKEAEVNSAVVFRQ